MSAHRITMRPTPDGANDVADGARPIWIGPVVAAMAVLLAFGWQFLTVHYNRSGNWTALYFTGEALPIPPQLASEDIYQFPGTGYDGQFYHYIAHDPSISTDVEGHLDDAALRYRRILVPAVAYLVAAGQAHLVDTAYLAVILGCIFFGSLSLSRLATAMGRHPAWGLAFLAVPSVLVSIDRLVADVALAALSVAYADAWLRREPRRIYVVIALAPLVRETGLLLTAAHCVWALRSSGLHRAFLFASSAIPAVFWFGFVASRTEHTPYPVSFVPMRSILRAFSSPASYSDKLPVIARLDQFTDVLALAGVVLALALGARWVFERGSNPVHLAGLLFATMGLLIQRDDHWHHVFDFGRVYSPLLIFLGIESLRRRRLGNVLPVLLMYPRIGMQVGSQIVGVVQGLLGW